jgi:ABC-type nitrate/sulfonate/bicarbonate transport system substrate-binding protein
MDRSSLSKKRRRFALGFTAALIATIASGIANAAETSKPIPLRVAYSAITVNQAIPWIAYEAGHFKKHGLEVELIHASSITALAGITRQ